ncbi:MAG: hypothetical protein HOA15_03800, partial [Candidatus Marinimicrobia bacterium]|nr:hypothetical protein [Candidatus Neomarinimicrobiota bacterium]
MALKLLSIFVLGLFLPSCSKEEPIKNSSSYIYAWTKDENGWNSDFLTVINANPLDKDYGSLVKTLPVGYSEINAHHTEHRLHESKHLFANGFSGGRTFIFNLEDSENPKLITNFTNMGDYTYPHSFERLPNGNVLATFQTIGEGNKKEGGLVEISPSGDLVRATISSDPSVEDFIRPYSLAILPNLDRVVSTSTDMRGADISRAVQIWQLSDLSLIKTIRFEPGPRGNENYDAAEPRVLRDGKTVLVSTFFCGLYRIVDLESENPTAEWVYSFPFNKKWDCALPVVAGDFWVQAISSESALVSLDVSDPANPKKVDELKFKKGEWPHWISLEPNGHRIIVAGGNRLKNKLLIVNLN